jgi:hypothetical protein
VVANSFTQLESNFSYRAADVNSLVLALYLSLLFVFLDSSLSRRMMSGALVPELNGQFDKLTDHTDAESGP